MPEMKSEPIGEQSPDDAPRVFVSYTHENRDHKRWVARLATDLRDNCVDAILDQWDLPLGGDLTLFMERGIRDADRVLLICTPTYARKANEGEGGVGYERLVVTGEIAKRIETTKFICVLRAGTKDESIPTFAQTRLFINFCDEDAYDAALEDLLRDIHQTPLQPKPQIGPHPFKQSSDIGPAFQVRNLSKKTSTSVDAAADIEELFARATAILRTNDQLGWNQLARNTRAQFATRLSEWRTDIDAQMRPNFDEGRWQPALQEACRIAAPLAVLSMTAVDSGIDGLGDQRSFLDDFVSAAKWQPNGYQKIVETPVLLAFVFHHLLGAFLISSKRHRDAIRLLTTHGQFSYGVNSYSELWQAPEMMGWVSSLNGSVTNGWTFLNSLWGNQRWLQHFFVRESDFYLGLRGYQFMAAFLELAEYLKRAKAVEELTEATWSVPPLFFTPYQSETRNADIYTSWAELLAVAIPDRSILDAIAEQYGVTTSSLRSAWPTATQSWLNFLNRLSRRSWFGRTLGDVPQLP